MKLRRLQETDLANAGPGDYAKRKKILRAVIQGRGPWSYSPARQVTKSVFNPRNPLGLETQRVHKDDLLKLVRKSCSKVGQANSCVEVVDLLYDWASDNVENSAEFHIPSMTLGTMGIVNYSESIACLRNGRPTFLFLDYRRSGGLDPSGRQFALSMMHRQVRRAFTQFSEADLRLLQFTQLKNFPRQIRETSIDEVDILDATILDEMIAETHAVWAELHQEIFGMRYKA